MKKPSERNPLFIPDRGPANRPRCPKCGGSDFAGRRIQGAFRFTCRIESCKHEWFGGLPQTYQDPLQPLPPESYVPPLRFGKDTKGNDVEIRRRPDARTDFRKGGLIPGPDEE